MSALWSHPFGNSNQQPGSTGFFQPPGGVFSVRPEERLKETRKWFEQVREIRDSYMELIYSAWQMLKDVYDYDDIANMPLSDLMRLIKFFTPKMKELQQARENAELTKALTQQQGG